jgi:quinol monooxygenase YgiN
MLHNNTPMLPRIVANRAGHLVFHFVLHFVGGKPLFEGDKRQSGKQSVGQSEAGNGPALPGFAKVAPPTPRRNPILAKPRQTCGPKTAERPKALGVKPLPAGREATGGLGTNLARRLSVVLSLLRLFPSREQRRQVLGILRSVQGPTQAQPHCLDCQVYEEDNCEGAVLFLERWDSEPELQRHVRSELYRRILEAVELSRSSPEVSFYSVSAARGLEWVETLRSGAAAETKPL